MNRRELIKGLALLPIGRNVFGTKSGSTISLLGEGSFTSLNSYTILHESSFVMDGHMHIMSRKLLQGLDIGQRYSNGIVDLPRIKEGKINAMFFSVYTPEPYYLGHFDAKNTVRVVELALDQTWT